MADDNEGRKPVWRLQRELRPGQPIQVTEPVEGADARELSPLCAAMVETLRAYRKAGRELVEGQYASVRELAPPHLRVPCHIYVVCCPDGVIVRYDAAGEEEPKVRGSCPDPHESLAEMAPAFSEQVIYVSDDPETYVPKHEGPGFILNRRDEHGEEVEFARFHPMICAPKTLPADFKLPLPPARPPCLASFHRELQFQHARRLVSGEYAGEGHIDGLGPFHRARPNIVGCGMAGHRNISSTRRRILAARVRCRMGAARLAERCRAAQHRRERIAPIRRTPRCSRTSHKTSWQSLKHFSQVQRNPAINS